MLDSDTAIKIYLTPKSTYTGEVVATWGGYSNSLTKNSAGQYVVEISDIPAHELSKTYTVTITTGSVNFDIEVSALSYVQGVIKSDETSAAMKEAVTSIYRYYRETMTYRGNRAEYN